MCETGAGTGKATVLVANHASLAGWHLTCVEPDRAMAAVLERNLSSISQLRLDIVDSGFEEFADSSQAEGRFDLLYAAQAWHWIAPERRALLAAKVLRHGGTLALIWNVASQHPPFLKAALDEVYGVAADPMTGRNWRPSSGPAVRVPPDAQASQPFGRKVTPAAGESDYASELQSSRAFGPVSVVTRPWSLAYDRDAWLEVLRTHSDHRMMPPGELEPLLERVGHVVDANGGEVVVEYDATAILARRAQRTGVVC
ncbi:MAG: class I SAM-dependent methyltransferase [Acidimicrobiales bacterium]